MYLFIYYTVKSLDNELLQTDIKLLYRAVQVSFRTRQEQERSTVHPGLCSCQRLHHQDYGEVLNCLCAQVCVSRRGPCLPQALAAPGTCQGSEREVQKRAICGRMTRRREGGAMPQAFWGCCAREATTEHWHMLCQGRGGPGVTLQPWDISDAALEAVDAQHSLSEQWC